MAGTRPPYALLLALLCVSGLARAQDGATREVPSQHEAQAEAESGNADEQQAEAESGNDADEQQAEAESGNDADEQQAGVPAETPNESERTPAGQLEAADGEDAAGEIATPTMEALPAKYALALVGDPDRGLVRFATQLDAALEARGLVRVRDPRLRTVLLGERANGGLPRSLSDARGALGGEEQSEALATISRVTGADAVLLVQRAEPNVRIYDATAGAFFRNARSEPDFIARALRAAAARRGTSPAAAARSVEPPPPPPVERPARRFFRKNWPYFVGGLLLAGALTWIIVESRREDPPPQLILRIRPGP